VAGAVGGGEVRDGGQRRGDGSDAQQAGETALEAGDVVAHGVDIAGDAACPFQDGQAFRGKALEARAADNEGHAERVLQRLDAGGEAGLGDAEGVRGAAEVFFAREGEEVFELAQHQAATSARG
jgi:hypothetical protein